jgi:hypothetical protein
MAAPDQRQAVTDTASGYRGSKVTSDLCHWVEGFNEGDHSNVLAHNLAEAEAHGDEAWLRYIRQLVEMAHEQSSRLARVLNDPEYRDRCGHGLDLDVRTRSKDTPKPPVTADARTVTRLRPVTTIGQPGAACEQCGARFKTSRSDARYCSVACRVAAHRARRAEKAENRA